MNKDDQIRLLASGASFRAGMTDLNGQARGKRLPRDLAGRVLAEGMRMPLSSAILDIWGADVAASPLLFETGDADGTLWPTDRGPVPLPWLDRPSAYLPMWMWREDGRSFGADPRHALSDVVTSLKGRGLSAMAGIELEFVLSHPGAGAPVDRLTGREMQGEAILSLAALDLIDGFVEDLFEGAALMGIRPASVISEAAPGQFEVTMAHAPVMRAADDALLFKMLVRGVARKHGMVASFIPKRDPAQSGSGMHVHVSMLDRDGQNVFDDGGPLGSSLLHAAIAGCLAAMPGSTLIFAPHGLSYERFVPGAHAPSAACWGYENRTVALRVPGGPPKARRLEHRVAGADANPYLLLTAILGAMLAGIEDALVPPTPISGNAYEEVDVAGLAPGWSAAIEAFGRDALIARIFPKILIESLTLCKLQEQHHAAKMKRSELLEALWESF